MSVGLTTSAQEMNLRQLKLIIAQKATIVAEQGSMVQYQYRDMELYLVADENHNRMRLMSGVVEESELKEGEAITLLEANYDKALDAKYALSDGVLWSVFTHPLKELQEDQVNDAIEQVINLVYTYGTSYSSTNLVFGGGE